MIQREKVTMTGNISMNLKIQISKFSQQSFPGASNHSCGMNLSGLNFYSVSFRVDLFMSVYFSDPPSGS